MAFFTGDRGIVTAGAITLKVARWTVQPEAELLETTHTGSAGFREYLASLKQLTGEVEFLFDAAANPHASPPNINPGEAVALKLYLRDPAGPFYDIPVAFIRAPRITSRVGAVVTVVFAFQSSGAFTLPVANF